MDLDTTLQLRKAGIFQFPLDSEQVIPRVLGNFLDPDAISDPNPNGGYTPAVCIDRLNLVYIVNDGPTDPTPPQIYFNGVRQENTVAIWRPASNVYGQGVMGSLQFTLNAVLDGVVSVNCGGSLSGTGEPLTNPMLGIFHMLTQYAGMTMADFDLGLCVRTQEDMDALGYPLFWCLTERLTIRDWLRDLLPHYHTDVSPTGQGHLGMILDRTLTGIPPVIDYHIPFYEVEDYGMPARAIRRSSHVDDVSNRITLRARQQWTTNELTATYTWDDVISQAATHQALTNTFELPGMYTEIHAGRWLSSYAVRHGIEPRTLTFRLKGLHGIPLLPPRLVTLEWPRRGWQRRLLKILRQTVRFEENCVELECIDCRREVDASFYAQNVSPLERHMRARTVYPWVPGATGSGGSLVDAPPDPNNECANGDFAAGDNGQWNLYGSNAAKQWTIIENPSETYQGRFYARSNLGMGNGSAASLRQRVEPGSYVYVSAKFRAHSLADGQPAASIYWYNASDAYLTNTFGNGAPNTATYLESVAFGQPPAGAVYYRPGIGFITLPTFGQWRADTVFAASGSLAQVLRKRQDALTTRNFLINGDFELGNAFYTFDPGLQIVNDPQLAARSGVWYAVAEGIPGATGARRLVSLTRVTVTPGSNFIAQVYYRTFNDPDGTARMGVTWMDGSDQILGENATDSASGPVFGWTLGAASMAVPANAVYALAWIEVFNQQLPQRFWCFDDWVISTD